MADRTTIARSTLQRVAAAVLVSGAAGLASGCAEPAVDKAGGTRGTAVTVLTMANGDYSSRGLEPFAAAVKRLSGGALEIEFKNDWRHGGPIDRPEVIGDVKTGRVDLAWAGPAAFERLGVRSFDALLAPLLIESYRLQHDVLASPLAATMLDEVDRAGVAGLGILPGPMRKAIGVDRERQPLTLTAGDTDAGLRRQTFAIMDFKPKSQAAFITANLNLWPRPEIVFANRQALTALTERQRAALRRAATNALPATLAFERADERAWAALACRSGLSLARPGDGRLTRLRRLLRPVYARLKRDTATRARIEQIAAIRAAMHGGAESDAPICVPSDADARPNGVRTRIDGVYRTTTTPADVARASGTAPADVAAEHYGRWRLVLDRGRLDFTQSSEAGTRWTRGVYTVTGGRVTWRVTAFGGDAPNDAGERLGDTFTFGWSVYRDLLTLSAVAGRPSPPRFRAKPWRRTGDAP